MRHSNGAQGSVALFANELRPLRALLGIPVVLSGGPVGLLVGHLQQNIRVTLQRGAPTCQANAGGMCTNPATYIAGHQFAHRSEGRTYIACGSSLASYPTSGHDPCQLCLVSLHVVLWPCDRANPCHGKKVAIGASIRGTVIRIACECVRYGARIISAAALDGAPWRCLPRPAYPTTQRTGPTHRTARASPYVTTTVVGPTTAHLAIAGQGTP